MLYDSLYFSWVIVRVIVRVIAATEHTNAVLEAKQMNRKPSLKAQATPLQRLLLLEASHRKGTQRVTCKGTCMYYGIVRLTSIYTQKYVNDG